MILKLTIVILNVGVGFLVGALDYKWHDRRTKLFRRARLALWIVLTVLVGASVVAVLREEAGVQALQAELSGLRRQASQSETSAEARAAREEQQLAALLSETRRLKADLAPFQRLAAQRYPGLTPADGLRQLNTEIERLRSKTAALELRAKPRALTPTTAANISSLLRSVPAGHVTFSIPLGDAEANHFALQLQKCFVDSGWKADGIDMAVYTLPPVGVEVGVQPAVGTPQLDAVLRALRLSGLSPRAVHNPSAPQGVITILIGAKE